MSTTYSHAGVSVLNGKMKVRFSNDLMRVKTMAKTGHNDIDIIQLKHPMTKAEAVQYLMDIDFDNGNPRVREALHAAAVKRGVIQVPRRPRGRPRKNPVTPVSVCLTPESEPDNIALTV